MQREEAIPEFFALREAVAERFAPARRPGEAVAEPPPPGAQRVSERLAQAIWFERMFQPHGLKTASGKRLEIADPGRWNDCAGPDFLAAEIVLDGRKIKGDIEVHTEASQWRRHEHFRDLTYNTVVLHVILRNDDGRLRDELHNGSLVERFEMEPFLFPDLDTIRETVSPDDYPCDALSGQGLCQDYWRNEEDSFVRRFLAAGGRERMEAKIQRLSDQLVNDDYGQLLYQALMTAMGFRANKALFFLLSKRAPATELLDHARDSAGHDRVERIEAVLLHVAGLAPRTETPPPDLDPHAIEYLNRINRHWAELSGYFADRLIPPTRRWHAGVRPVNLPERRLAGIAHFLARNAAGCDLFGPLVRRLRAAIPSQRGSRAMSAYLKSVEGMLAIDAPEDFWAARYTFQAKPAARPMSLIGDSRARSIAFNSLIPLLILWSRREGGGELEEFAWRWFDGFPLLESNNVERFMRRRLFGDDPRGKSLVDREPFQQGLFQVFHSCCNNRERDCEECYFLRRPGAARLGDGQG